MKKVYMLDIETLASNKCPVLLQISCVSFDLEEHIDLKFQIMSQDKSFIDPETVKWWSDKAMPKGDLRLEEGLKQLRVFLKKAKMVWSHNFDFDVIQRICETYDIKLPYHYRCFRDIGTLVSVSGIDLKNYDWSKKTHDALDDCKFQVEYCTDALAAINPNK